MPGFDEERLEGEDLAVFAAVDESEEGLRCVGEGRTLDVGGCERVWVEREVEFERGGLGDAVFEEGEERADGG